MFSQPDPPSPFALAPDPSLQTSYTFDQQTGVGCKNPTLGQQTNFSSKHSAFDRQNICGFFTPSHDTFN